MTFVFAKSVETEMSGQVVSSHSTLLPQNQKHVHSQPSGSEMTDSQEQQITTQQQQ